MTTSKHNPEQVKAVIEALEKLIAEPSGVNMIHYINLALAYPRSLL